jgi:hypothetical protein
LFGTGTIRVKDGEEDILVLMGSDCRMGLRGWEGLRLPDSYETGVEFSHPRTWKGSGPGQGKAFRWKLVVGWICEDGGSVCQTPSGTGVESAIRGRGEFRSEAKERCFDVN